VGQHLASGIGHAARTSISRPKAAAARSAGVEVAVVDHDALTRGGDPEPPVARVPHGGEAVYRGWMLRSEQYAAMADALTARDVVLRTSAEQHRRAHELPGWYTAMDTVTPQSVWTRDDSRTAFTRACATLPAGPAVLRDYTKSMKHHWHEAAFIPDIADTDAAWRVANRFRDLRGDDFDGGFVLRRFEHFTSAEVCTWWVHGTCRLRTAHPDTPDELPPADLDLTAVTPLMQGLRRPFVTADLVRHDDGRASSRSATDRSATVPTAHLRTTSSQHSTSSPVDADSPRQRTTPEPAAGHDLAGFGA
jgi:hypothetical protein